MDVFMGNACAIVKLSLQVRLKLHGWLQFTGDSE